MSSLLTERIYLRQVRLPQIHCLPGLGGPVVSGRVPVLLWHGGGGGGVGWLKPCLDGGGWLFDRTVLYNTVSIMWAVMDRNSQRLRIQRKIPLEKKRKRSMVVQLFLVLLQSVSSVQEKSVLSLYLKSVREIAEAVKSTKITRNVTKSQGTADLLWKIRIIH